MFISINGYALYLYSQKKINIGILVSILIVVLYLLNNLSEMRGEMRDLIFNIGVIKETQNYLNDLLRKSKLNNINDKSNLDINIHKGETIFKNVSFKYQGTDDYIFKNLTLLIKAKQTIAIVGKNGSGKSTFTKLIMKYCQNQVGDIYIDRVNIKNVDTDKLRQKMSYMPQNPRLFNRSVLENITYGTNKNRQDVEKIIKELNLEKLFSKLDDGLNTNAGKNGNNLSGGQRQVVFLLRCLLKDTHIMILDEPTSALDIENKKIVMDVVKKVIKNKTALLITHDPEILDSVDRVIKLHKGKIISDVTK
jgi:ABC-type multidrug transport system fused ATPase/permease subunit